MSPKTDKEIQDESIFEFAFYYDEKEKEHSIEVYDADNELCAVYTGTDFGNLLRHAVYDVDPVLAAASWTKDYLEFSENHNIEEGPEI